MTQEELRAKLESYDIKGATLKQLIADRDTARDLYLKCSRMYSDVCEADDRCYYGRRSPREINDAVAELLRAIRSEEEEYYHHAETLEYEINERLSKIDSNN